MATTTFASNLRKIIIEELSKAQFDIYVAVAWFTDKFIFNKLTELAKQGVEIKISLYRDITNQKALFDHRDIRKFGGEFFSSDHHHKFCVIDRRTVLTGSCNWTSKGLGNYGHENLVKIEERQEADKYAKLFLSLKSKNNIQPHEIDQSDYFQLKLLCDVQGIEDINLLNVKLKSGKSFAQTLKTNPIVFKNRNDGELWIVASKRLKQQLANGDIDISKSLVYRIVHIYGEIEKGILVVGTEEDNETWFDPLWII
jgi:phosphatidylserine/phosphatidylglycerophosphate/cardiolipin synthase-like enzyme